MLESKGAKSESEIRQQAIAARQPEIVRSEKIVRNRGPRHPSGSERPTGCERVAPGVGTLADDIESELRVHRTGITLQSRNSGISLSSFQIRDR